MRNFLKPAHHFQNRSWNAPCVGFAQHRTTEKWKTAHRCIAFLNSAPLLKNKKVCTGTLPSCCAPFNKTRSGRTTFAAFDSLSHVDQDPKTALHPQHKTAHHDNQTLSRYPVRGWSSGTSLVQLPLETPAVPFHKGINTQHLPSSSWSRTYITWLAIFKASVSRGAFRIDDGFSFFFRNPHCIFSTVSWGHFSNPMWEIIWNVITVALP